MAGCGKTESLKTVIHHTGQYVPFVWSISCWKSLFVFLHLCSFCFVMDLLWNVNKLLPFVLCNPLIQHFEWNYFQPHSNWTDFDWRSGLGVGLLCGSQRLYLLVSLQSGDLVRSSPWDCSTANEKGGRFSKAVHASLEVLVSSVGLWLRSQWFSLYLKLSFSSLAAQG